MNIKIRYESSIKRRQIMKNTIFTLAFFAVSLSTSAHAAMQKGDWISSGDNKVAVDTDTGLEWLTLDNTKGKSISEVVSQLGAGGQYAGWRLPTESEVFELTKKMYGSMIGHINTDTSYNSDIVWAWKGDGRQQALFNYFDLMGLTKYVQGRDQYGANYSYWSYGIHLNDNPGTGNQSSEVLFSGAYSFRSINSRDHFYAYTGLSGSTYTKDFKDLNTGVYLVSDGGLTLSSKLDPTLNIKNPQAPINQAAPVSVSMSFGGLLLFLLPLSRLFRKS